MKEIPDGSVPVRLTKIAKRKEEIMEECSEIASVEEDEQSLFNSDKLDEIIGKE